MEMLCTDLPSAKFSKKYHQVSDDDEKEIEERYGQEAYEEEKGEKEEETPRKKFTLAIKPKGKQSTEGRVSQSEEKEEEGSVEDSEEEDSEGEDSEGEDSEESEEEEAITFCFLTFRNPPVVRGHAAAFRYWFNDFGHTGPYNQTVLVQGETRTVIPKGNPMDSPGDSPRRVKRLLPSSVSSSPQPKKGHKKNSTVKKSLNFVAETLLPNKENEEPSNVELITNQGRDIPLLAEIELNVEDLSGKQTTELKVVNPNGRVDKHSTFDDKTKSMILNLCRKNWTTVSNLSVEHPNVRQETGETFA
ncbi:hypothetical protein OS493_024026 [Desmophyllum pertusum]|uniref:Uncharacterized protein n=1 Tax=Desmophyllum pertusum TaxID=174260 RepID=A0A9X0D404_9CNID|nr:hypothetical protein OS493_024026 [Desmophyllum pertusum]